MNSARVLGHRIRGVALRVVYPVASLGGLILVWHAAVVLLHPPRFLLPSPALVAMTAWEKAHILGPNALVTAYEIALAFALSAVVGVLVGLAGAKWGFFSRNVFPLVLASQSVPKLALAPLLTVWLGFGLTPKILIAFLIAFFPVAVNTAIGIRSIHPDTLLLARAIGLGWLGTLRKIEIPASLPYIFGGLRIAAPFAVIGAVVGEYVGANAGLGRLTLVASARLDTALLFAALATLTAMGLLAYALVALAEALLIPWRRVTAMELRSSAP